MRLAKYRTAAGLPLLACLACLAGCGKGDEMEGLGGGASSPVEVTILPKPSEAQGGGATGGSTATVAGYGHLKGKVTMKGAAPTLPQLVSPAQVKPDDRAFCVVDRIPNEKLVSHDGAIQNVFIYLSAKPAGTKMPQAEPQAVLFDQKFCTFTPHATVVLTGQPIHVVNDDGIAHNVHTKPTRSGEFNQTIGGNNREGFMLSYKNAERTPVRVVCDFHTWMLAWQLPLDHPYGAVTNEQGEFEIRDLPAGKHKFVIWHEGNTLTQKEVIIEPDAEATLELEFSPADLKLAEGRGPRSRMVVLSMNP